MVVVTDPPGRRPPCGGPAAGLTCQTDLDAGPGPPGPGVGHHSGETRLNPPVGVGGRPGVTSPVGGALTTVRKRAALARRVHGDGRVASPLGRPLLPTTHTNIFGLARNVLTSHVLTDVTCSPTAGGGVPTAGGGVPAESFCFPPSFFCPVLQFQ